MTNPQATIGNMFAQSAAVLSRPSVATFERFETRGNTRDAYIYVLLAALVSAVIAAFFALFRSDISALGQFISRLIAVPLGFAIFTGLVYYIGRSLFRGTGTYSEVAYTFALFFVPISIVGTVIGVIPVLGWLVGVVLGLPNIYFGFLAVQSSMNIREQTGAVVTLVLSAVGYLIVNGIIGSLLLSAFAVTSRS